MSMSDRVQEWADKELRAALDTIVQNFSDAKLAAYEAGKAASRPPAGHIMEADGTIRKVLGTLPVTADGCVCGELVPLWVWTDDDGLQPDNSDRLFLADYNGHPVEYCYSTREAAEAARAAKGGA